VNGGNGFEVTGGDSVAVNDSLAFSNGQHGILVTGGTGVILDGNTCSNNSQQVSVTFSGIRIENNVTGVRVVHNRSGDFILTLPNKQKHGISVGSVGTAFLLVTENDLRDNKAGPLDTSTNGPGHVITRNLGVAPIGVSAIPVSGSPFTYTNTDGVPEAIDVTGGVVSAVVKNPVTILTASPCTVYLEPGEAVTVTYSVPPTMNKDHM